jgi:hypothetical protein
MARSRRGTPSSLAEILKERFHALGLEKQLHQARVFSRWEEAVGSRIAAHSRPSYVRNGRLTVVVDSPAWSQQLSLLRPDLLRKIAGVLGVGVITDIYLTSGTVDRPAPGAEEAPSEALPVAPPGDPDPELVAAIDREASLIKDEALRKSFRSTLLTATRRTKPPR